MAAAPETSTIGSSPGEYRARSSAAIPPGLFGQVPYRLPQACSVTDIICPEGFVVTRVSFGKRTIELEAGERLRDKLRAEPYESTAPSYIVTTVKNETDDPRVVEIAICVTGEHGPVGGPSPFAPSARGAGAFAVDEDGGPMPYSPMPTKPRAPEAPIPKERLPSGFVQSVRRPPIPPPVPSPRSKQNRLKYDRSSRRQRPQIITVHAEPSPQAVENPGETSAAIELAHLSAGGGQGVTTTVMLFRAYAEALMHTLERNIPVSRAYRSTIARAFTDEGFDTGRNQVALVLPAEIAREFGESVRKAEEHRADSRDIVRQALAAALNPHEQVAAAPPESSAAVMTSTTEAGSSNEKRNDSGRPAAMVLPLTPRQAPDGSSSGAE